MTADRSRARRDPDDGMRKLFASHLPRVHWCAMELGLLGVGTPDHNGCLSGVDFWIEYKATESHAVGREPEQVGWISRRMRAGGRVFVATRRRHTGGARRGEPVDELWIHEGWDAPLLRAEGLLSAPAVLQLSGGPSHWDWDAVLRALTEWTMSARRAQTEEQ